MRIALLSNVTVEIFARQLAKTHAVWTPPGFGAWFETALAPPPALRTFEPETIAVLLDDRFTPSEPDRAERLAAAREALAASFPRAVLLVPDLARLAADVGPSFHDERAWFLARQPFSLGGLRVLETLFGVKKALALDLDGTLWKGVVAEDGVAGIVPDGAFQTEIRALQRRGIVLVALSKNDAAVVEPVWQDPRMALAKDDFVALAIDWNAKSANLAHLAETLNLPLDAFVFVDDRPVERARMRAELPAVAVPPFPPVLADFFPLRDVTGADQSRTETYRAVLRRAEWRAGRKLEDWLAGLETWVDVHEARADEEARLAQLSRRTNQFNVCTNRYAEEDVRRFRTDGRHVLYAVEAGDRFGDEGVAAFVLVAWAGGETAEIVDWVLSCRAMNRRIEEAVEAHVEDDLRRRGVKTVRATWRQTAKNGPAQESFDRFGFTCVRATPAEREYVRDLERSRCVPPPYVALKGLFFMLVFAALLW